MNWSRSVQIVWNAGYAEQFSRRLKAGDKGADCGGTEVRRIQSRMIAFLGGKTE